MPESLWGQTRRYSQFFDCYAVRLAPDDPIKAPAAARRLLRDILRNDRQVAVILKADQQWERSCAVCSELIRLTDRRALRTARGTRG